VLKTLLVKATEDRSYAALTGPLIGRDGSAGTHRYDWLFKDDASNAVIYSREQRGNRTVTAIVA